MYYSIDQCYLYKCKSKKMLSKKLGLEVNELISLSKNPQYNKFNKGNREIRYAIGKLKIVQSKIHKFLSRIERPDYLNGGIKGKSIITNSEVHRLNGYWLVFDISHFYDNCDRNYIYNFFLNDLKCSPDVSNILTNLTTFNNHLIQGTSTSVDLSFLAYRRMFEELYKVSRSNNLIFSTYVDDFTFSGNTNYSFNKIRSIVPNILNRYGHLAKKSKIRTYTPKDAKSLTGTIVYNKEIKIPNKRTLEIVDLLKNVDENSNSHDLSSILGKISSVKQIQPNAFEDSFNRIKKLKKRDANN